MAGLCDRGPPDRSVPITSFSKRRDYPSPSGAAGACSKPSRTPDRPRSRSRHESTVGSVSKAAHAVADGRGGAFNARPAEKRLGVQFEVGLWPAIGL